jgi:carboxypeptidase Q
MIKKPARVFFFVFLVVMMVSNRLSHGQDDSVMLKRFFTEALVKGQSYENLRYLCKNIGPRLSGSANAAEAVTWTENIMKSYKLDSVWLQPVYVPKWVRGKKESAKIISSSGKTDVNVTALGNSVGTGKKGIQGNIVEFGSLEEMKKHGDEVAGKIVFLNEPMDLSLYSTGRMYGKTGNTRYIGPQEAGKLGAVGVVVRSLTTSMDDFPHTGATDYGTETNRIPAVAISTNDAVILSREIAQDPNLEFYFRTNCEMLGEVLSYNVIGQINGSETPDEYIVFGGHLDSWDLAEGAHDDGAGIVHSLEAMRLLKDNYRPRRSIRAVMFINEENGLAGGTEYAKMAQQNKEKHVVAIESDGGGFLPMGFGINASDEVIKRVQSWSPLFKPYRLFVFEKGYGGADIGPLNDLGVPLLGLEPSDQRYFDMHHSAKDVFEIVNRRELELGCASMASMVYLIDRYGL